MSDTRQNIMHYAEQFVRKKGANGFSYADLAAQLGIRKASIHYHFPNKNDLLQNLIQNYQTQFLHALNELDNLPDPQERIAAFVDLYRQGLKVGSLCLCGMLTLDSEALTQPMQQELDTFFQQLGAWLTNVFDEGSTKAGWTLSASPASEAAALLALVQGAQLIARNAEKEVEKFDAIVQPQLNRYS